jgi:hypothetical protein
MRTVTRGLAMLLAVSAVGLLAGVASAQKSDILEDAKLRQELATQKMQKYVDEVIGYANKLADAGRKAEAIQAIQQATAVVKDSSDLQQDKRDKMLRSLAFLEKQFDTELKNPVVKNPNPPVRQPIVVDRKAAYDQAGKTLSVRGTTLVDIRGMRDEHARRYLGVMSDIDKSNLPPIGDYELPSDWKERSERRLKSANPMTERERAILKQLNTTISVDFKNEKFQDVIDYLQKITGQPIVVDAQAMREANVTYEGSTVNVKIGASTRSVLKKTLAELGLTYVVKDETIFVTTPARAREMMTTRSYYVGDLVGSIDRRFSPVYNQLQMMQQVNQMLVLIQTTVDPDSWEYKGGPGSIYFDPVTMTFVVRQSAEVHFLLGVGMRR